jgi:streptogramin lyase
MTSTLQTPTTLAREFEGDYPMLLRMGHRFETSIGQRLLVDGFYGAIDVALGGDGLIYVMNKHVTQAAGRVRIAVCDIDDQFKPDIRPRPDGEPEIFGEEKLPSPVGFASDGEGNLYGTDEYANVVVHYTTDGKTVGYWGDAGDGPGQFNAPSGIHVDPVDGNLWVVNTRNSKIQKFTPDGTYISGFGEVGSEPGQLDHPWGIGFDPISETLLVADWRNDRIQRFTQSGELLQIIGPDDNETRSLNHPSDVAIDAHGDIYVCDRGSDRAVQYNHRGLFIEAFIGDAVMTERGADKLMANPDMLQWRDHIIDLDREKRFWKPTSVTVDDQFRVYILDSGRYRIQIYRKTFRELQPGQYDALETYTDPHLN